MKHVTMQNIISAPNGDSVYVYVKKITWLSTAMKSESMIIMGLQQQIFTVFFNQLVPYIGYLFSGVGRNL
jgi:hypothetical protein